MKRILSPLITDTLYCALGFLLGYIAFALLNLWMYGDFWMTMGVGLPLHWPVAAAYTAILVFLRRRWPHIISRPALLVCGVGMGFFPVLGAFPVYFFRFDIAPFILGVHIAVLGSIILISYFIARWSKRTRQA
jgi:hypothetical protein